ncbi:hypothetical protein ACPCBX_06250 [Streptomyces tuirus]|uniref:Uncharacterized protein n=1 Tax=Streptomyces tuirus TaxID=68278 RepID=A0A7G1N634_9ACTN|nr:hypothetical protein [Streptomyces tuirus]BCL18259.1 hypothetical protein GCM10017668_01020 [Streptomyces tuirus]
MSQPQYPEQQPPGWGAPPPQPPKKRSTGKAVGFGCLGLLIVAIIIGITAALGGSSEDSKKDPGTEDTSSSQPESNESEREKKEEPTRSQADIFKECVAQKGTPTEKTAVKHVTKVTGADERNNILDSAEVFTDYTGGIVGPHAADGKLIASAFATCYDSNNGIVTVYDKNGEILSNGNY